MSVCVRVSLLTHTNCDYLASHFCFSISLQLRLDWFKGMFIKPGSYSTSFHAPYYSHQLFHRWNPFNYKWNPLIRLHCLYRGLFCLASFCHLVWKVYLLVLTQDAYEFAPAKLQLADGDMEHNVNWWAVKTTLCKSYYAHEHCLTMPFTEKLLSVYARSVWCIVHASDSGPLLCVCVE